MISNNKRTTEIEASHRRILLEHAEQKRILQGINTVNNLVINSTSINEMLDQILDEFLQLFNCQRAWLTFPCDPQAEFLLVPKEKTVPQWPGAGIDNLKLPMDDFSKSVISEALANNHPIAYDSQKRKIHRSMTEVFGVASQLLMAIYPKVGKPWLLGIHHCGQEHIYTENDIDLFNALGGRLADGLSSMLSEQITQQSEALQRALLNNTNSPIAIRDLAGKYLLTNRKFNEVFGNVNDCLIGNDGRSIFSQADCQLMDFNNAQVVLQQRSMEFEERLPTVNGIKTFLSSTSPLFDSDNKIYAVCTIATDITARLEAEKEIYRLAHYDDLTQLPNRLKIKKELTTAIEQSTQSRKFGALIYADLDNFKTLNDTKGHSYGDMLLKETARILKSCISAQDLVARIGGDEFLIILQQLDLDEQAALDEVSVIANRVLSSLQTVFVGDDFQHHVTASLGITLFNGQQQSAEELLKRVDAATYMAKKAGRNNIQYFDPSLQQQLEYRARIASQILDAIAEDNFEVYYQAQVDSVAKVIGAEALIRWNHPELGMISPADFIPLAEENDSIIALGNWVMLQGCRQLVLWQQHPQLCQLSLSINVSAKQFHQDDFVDTVQQIIDVTQAPIQKLKIELTESLDQKDIEGNIVKMNQLIACGISISMDDFGTGFSSLNCLRKLPLDQLKIDQSFVEDIGQDASSDIIVKTIIGMASNLRMEVIAEGVETTEQRDFLLRHGCKLFQGYLFGKPFPVALFEQYTLGINGEKLSGL